MLNHKDSDDNNLNWKHSEFNKLNMNRNKYKVMKLEHFQQLKNRSNIAQNLKKQFTVKGYKSDILNKHISTVEKLDQI